MKNTTSKKFAPGDRVTFNMTLGHQLVKVVGTVMGYIGAYLEVCVDKRKSSSHCGPKVFTNTKGVKRLVKKKKVKSGAV